VLQRLEARWASLPAAKSVTLHYIDGHIDVDVELPLEVAGDRASAEALERAYRDAVAGDALIVGVRLIFS
jgi:hypothetical protein